MRGSRLYAGAGGAHYAVWSHPDDQAVTTALDTAGFHRDLTTRPMLCRLDKPMTTSDNTTDAVVHDVDPAGSPG